MDYSKEGLTRQHCLLKTLHQEGEAWHEIEEEGRFNINDAQPLCVFVYQIIFLI
jgi:hypothetical protein